MSYEHDEAQDIIHENKTTFYQLSGGSVVVSFVVNCCSHCFVGCVWSLLICAVLRVVSSFVIISLGKKIFFVLL